MARISVPFVDSMGDLLEWLRESFAPHVQRTATKTVTFTAANTPYRVRHGLDAVPIGFVVIDADRACRVFRDRDTGAADKRYIFLECDTAGAVVTVQVV